MSRATHPVDATRLPTAEEAVPDRILIVDDERAIRCVLSMIVDGGGYTPVAVETGEEAIARLEAEAFGCMLVDKNLPGIDGLQVIQVARDVRPYCSCVMVTGYASVESAVEALRLGADDYLEKPLGDPSLMVERIRALIRNRRKEYRRHQKLAALVARDPLTGLFNHVYFHQELKRAVANAVRTGLPVSLVFMDIDGFKTINDTLGHQVGDRVLVQLADLISPQADPGTSLARLRTQDILARYGGDEFAAILVSTAKSGGAVVAERMRHTIAAHEFNLPGFSRLTLSAGVAAFPDDADAESELVRAADNALYAAKHSGRNRVLAFEPHLDGFETGRKRAADESVARLEALDELIRDKKVHFDFQPIVRLDDGSIFGYEALCRPEVPRLPDPRTLLTTAERGGRIQDLGRVLREKAVEAIRDLPERCALFVNLHPNELHDRSLYRPEALFEPWADRIVFELTEAIAIRDIDRLKDQVARLRERGFRIAVDDLGAAYSGLNMIAVLEPDLVKLDIVLVRQMKENKHCNLLVHHLVEYAREMNIGLIAEGIETEAELRSVVEVGISLGQGFLLAPPGPSFTEVSWRPPAVS